MRLRSGGRTVLVLAFLALAPASGPAALAGGDVNFLLGQKLLDEDDWDPVDHQTVFGAEVSFGRESWPVRLAADLVFSAGVDEGIFDDTGFITEWCFGVRKVWKAGTARPYIGGGLAFIDAYRELDGFFFVDDDDSDGAVGPWFGGGVFWRLGQRFNMGVGGRISAAEVTLFGQDVQAGGVQLNLLLGWGWPDASATP